MIRSVCVVDWQLKPEIVGFFLQLKKNNEDLLKRDFEEGTLLKFESKISKSFYFILFFK
jgi:hypothetical protein